MGEPPLSTAPLDDAAALRALDTHDLFGAAARLHEHARIGLMAAESFVPPSGWRPQRVLIVGMGGSAIGGDVVRAALADELTAPLEVIRGYGLPGGVDGESFVCAVSYSGNTEETLTAYRLALSRGARTAVIATGGQLADEARRAKAPVVTVPSGLAPRAALGYLLFALLGVLRRVGAIAVGDGLLEESIGHQEAAERKFGISVPAAANPAKRIAGDLLNRFPIIYGGTAALAVAAYRWRTQLNENAKVLASHHRLPELNHNEVVGWDLPADQAKQTAVVLLRSATEDARTRIRAQFTADLVRSRAGAFHEALCGGGHALLQTLEGIVLGDFVSLYLAALRQVDPYPVATIDALKRTLAQPR